MAFVVAALIAIAICVVVRRHYSHDSLHRFSVEHGCKPVKLLPNSWLLPFGLDKLRASLRAERARRFPALILDEHELHGETYAQHAGGQYIVLTRDPRNISTVLSKQFRSFEYGPVRHACFGPLLGDGIFTTDGVEWERSRRLLAPIFHKPHFPDLRILEDHVQELFRAIDTGDAAVDMKHVFYSFTLDVATGFFIGKSTNMLSQDRADFSTESGTSMSSAFNVALRWLARRERLKAFYWLLNGKEFRNACTAAHEALDAIIQEAVHSPFHNTNTVLSHILKDTQDVRTTRDEIINLLFAARDSNSSLLSWLFYSLAREPAVYQALRREIISTLGPDPSRTPTGAELSKMDYLSNVINETLRLFPAVPLNGRLCVHTTTFSAGGGEKGEDPILIPKGTLICIAPYATQRSKQFYGDDANEFLPERWAKRFDVKEETRKWTFQPFSGGPRKCLGENYALKLSKYTACRIIQQFKEIKPAGLDGEEVKVGKSWQDEIRYQVGLTMAPEDGVWVRLKP